VSTNPDLDSIASREDLAGLIDDRSDDEIVEVVTDLGVDNVLRQIAEAMVERFQPDKAAGESAVIQWDIQTPDGIHSFHLTVSDGTCATRKGVASSPRVALSLTLVDFLRFIAGKMDGMSAFMSGKLKVTGDLMFAQMMQSWFDA
jgi:putative sterol carrier protein